MDVPTPKNNNSHDVRDVIDMHSFIVMKFRVIDCRSHTHTHTHTRT